MKKKGWLDLIDLLFVIILVVENSRKNRCTAITLITRGYRNKAGLLKFITRIFGI